eukprot:GEMP01025688.1.p1 GENE.GEMP01025688.1~~GEMP01025688.1.p1  ORF type:complete len:314 (+),score=58.50 GEMP01025688.1:79-1020(+)
MSLPLNWIKYTTDDGKDYYHNSVTNVTTWDFPESNNANEDVYTPDLKDLDLNSIISDDVSSKMPKFTPTPIGKETAPLHSSMDATDGEAVSSSKGFLASWFKCFDIEAMQQYFDLSTNDFVVRLQLAGNPLVHSDVDLSAKPDFYGPFWIVTTAVIFLSGTANWGNAIMAEEGAHAITNWNLVYIAASMLYGALIMVPVLVSLILRFSKPAPDINDQKVNVALFICVYGYSFLWLIPCSILATVPNDFAKWVVVLGSMFMSCTFVRNQLWADMSVDLPKARYALIALLFGSHAVIYSVYRLYFFEHFVKAPET